jgi:tRNA (guanine-N7-)-methyltransferase
MTGEGEETFIPRLYGRRKAKPLKPTQARLMQDLLPRLSFQPPAAGPLDPAALLPGKRDYALEIGFGGGEHLAALAEAQPGTGFLGAEPFINGVGKLLVQIEARRLENIRILHGDARPLLAALADGSLAAMFVLFPDPWPKKRHEKRRIVSPWFLSEAARVLQTGGRLRVASDIDAYIAWTLMHAQSAPAFEWTAERAEDWHRRAADWPPTRYEAKAIAAGRRPAYLEFRRI